MHEILHALGFWHEQSRLDRDKYVKINFDNILEEAKSDFSKYDVGEADTLGYAYVYYFYGYFYVYYYLISQDFNLFRKDQKCFLNT